MKNFIIIGNSAAGIAAVEAIRQKDKESKITVVSDEDYSAYCRCLISYYLAAEVKEDKLVYRNQDFYKENNIELLLNKEVERVDPKKNRIVLADKTGLNYDYLLIATGARPKFPKIDGIKKTGVFGFRTIKDAKTIQELLAITQTACVLGGGLVGIKCAYALKKRNINVKVIIKSRQILSQMLDIQSADIVQRKLEENGLEIIFGSDATEVIGNGDIKALKLDSGKVIGCSMVVVGKGVQPNTDLIKDTAVQVSEGIRVNEYMQTNIPNIFSAGDVCESMDLTQNVPAVNALWPVAVEQGRIAGFNMAGESAKYGGSMGMNVIEFFGLSAVSLGIYKTKEDDRSIEQLVLNNAKASLYKKLILKDNCLVGAVLVGDIRNSGIFLRLIREKINISSIKEKLLEENFGYPEILNLVKEKENLYV